jgi:hypothetical protein
MSKRLLLVTTGAVLCGSCLSCWPPPCPGLPVQVPLNQANCILDIAQAAGATDAQITATIVNWNGCPVGMGGGQSVSVNGQVLQSSGLSGEYGRTTPVADEYVVTVAEPTRGVQDTVVVAAPFAITAPQKGATASLSGFTLTWSNPEEALKVGIHLSQNLLGHSRSKEIGPFANAGSKTLTAQDLMNFQQGANIVITVTWTFEQNSIAGFNQSKLTYERSETTTIVPGP